MVLVRIALQKRKTAILDEKKMKKKMEEERLAELHSINVKELEASPEKENFPIPEGKEGEVIKRQIFDESALKSQEANQ